MSAENHQDEFFHNPYESNATKFFDLNDDCVLEVFERLSVLDLCALKWTCKRYFGLADYFFDMAYKTLNFNNWNIKSEYSLLTEDDMRIILSTFGTKLESIIVNADSFQPESKVVLQILNEFCGGQPSLRFFKMVKFVIDDETVEECDRLWSNLQQLTIDKCYVDDSVIEKLLRKCSSLTELEMIRQMNTDGRCLLYEFPNLQGFALRSNDNFDPVCMNTFLRKNPQLRTLSLMGCNFVDDEIFEIIADNLVNLEVLYIRVVHVTNKFEANLENLLRLQQLRKLEFNCGLLPINTFITGLAMTNRIESLGISSAELTPDLCSALCNLKNLKTLKLMSMYDGNVKSLKLIAQQLPRLKELHIIESDFINFHQIIEFIEHAPRVEKLVVVESSKILPINSEMFVRLAESVQKRIDKLQLCVHLDYFELKTTKENISDELRKEYLHILQLSTLSWEENYKNGIAVSENRYFAEEGGAYDYDPCDDDIDRGSDNYEFEDELEADPYNGIDIYIAFMHATVHLATFPLVPFSNLKIYILII